MNPIIDANTLATVVIFLLVPSMLLAIPGTILGLQERLIVYHGKTDLVLSYLAPISLLVWLPGSDLSRLLYYLLIGLNLSLLVWSIAKTWTANHSLGKTILVLPTKFVLAWVIAFCALLAVGGMLGSMKQLKDRQYGKAARQFAIGAVAGILFLKMKEMMKKLIRHPVD